MGIQILHTPTAGRTTSALQISEELLRKSLSEMTSTRIWRNLTKVDCTTTCFLHLALDTPMLDNLIFGFQVRERGREAVGYDKCHFYRRPWKIPAM